MVWITNDCESIKLDNARDLGYGYMLSRAAGSRQHIPITQVKCIIQLNRRTRALLSYINSEFKNVM